MQIRKTSTALLFALALSAVQVPFTSTVATAQQPPSISDFLCERIKETPLVLNVTGNQADKDSGSLAAAVNTVKDHFSRCGDKLVTATINLNSGEHVLPNDFDFQNTQGRLTIQPAQSNARVRLRLPEGRSSVATRNISLTINRADFDFDQTLFEAGSSLTLNQARLTGKGGVAVRATDNLKANHQITILDTTADNTALVALGNRPAGVFVNHVVATLNTPVAHPFVDAPAVDEASGQGNALVAVQNLALNTVPNPNPQPAVRVGRPMVTVNGLVHRDPSAGSISILLDNPPRATHPNHQINNVLITRSQLSVDNAVIERANPNAADSLITTNDAVTFTRNVIAPEASVRPRVAVFPKGETKSPATAFKAECNYWGEDLSVRQRVQAVGTNLVLEKPQGAVDLSNWKCVNRPPLTNIEDIAKPIPRDPGANPGGGSNPGGGANPGGPAPSNPGGSAPSNPGGPAPSNPDTGIAGERGRISGPTRIETSVAASQNLYPQGANTVILARADVGADSVSAIPLAQELKAPVLLTLRDELHPSVAEEIKRLMPKGGRVIIMGGDQALSPKVSDAVAKLGGKVERIAGPNRAATAVATATQLQGMNKATQVLLADGNDWQPDLIAGPVAAKVDGVTLLTAGSTISPETKAFLDANKSLKVTAIGNAAARSGATQTQVTGTDAADLSLKVAMAFFKDPKAAGFATTADFADPLVGGSHIAHHQGPLLLVDKTVNQAVIDWGRSTETITDVFIYGGDTRISKAEADRLNSIKQPKRAS